MPKSQSASLAMPTTASAPCDATSLVQVPSVLPTQAPKQQILQVRACQSRQSPTLDPQELLAIGQTLFGQRGGHATRNLPEKRRLTLIVFNRPSLIRFKSLLFVPRLQRLRLHCKSNISFSCLLHWPSRCESQLLWPSSSLSVGTESLDYRT